MGLSTLNLVIQTEPCLGVGPHLAVGHSHMGGMDGVALEGFGAFNAARLRGIPAELLIFPDENHWVLKPQNGVLWQRTFFGWLDKWLK